MLKRNFNYNVGNIDYNLDGTRLVCKVAGTTGIDPLRIPSEATEVVDGTVTWSLSDEGGGADSIAEMSAPSSIFITLPTDGTAFSISAGDYIEVTFTSSAGVNAVYVAIRKDAQSSWGNQYLFQHRTADWETRQVHLLDGFSEGKLECQGTMSGIHSVSYRYSVGHAKALGLI